MSTVTDKNIAILIRLKKSISHFFEKSNKEALSEALVEAEELENKSSFPDTFRKKLLVLFKTKAVYIGGLALVSASLLGNVLNFVYNSLLGRVLGFEHFVLIGLMSGLLSLASIFFGAFTTTANYRSAFLIGKYGEDAGYQFWKFIRRRAIFISVVIAIISLLFIPFMMQFFHVEKPMFFILFSLILLVGLASGVDRGYISAKLLFGSLAIINLFDPVIRIIIGVILVVLDEKMWAYGAIPIAIIGTFIVGWLLIIRNNNHTKEMPIPKKEINYFPLKFFGVALITNFSETAFSTFDILLAAHYLSQAEAGQYTLLSLVGKMIYFMAGLTTPFIVPLISRLEGSNKSTKNTILILLASAAVLAFIGFILFGVLGKFSLPILYGKKAYEILSFVVIYTFGMMCYTTSKVLIDYYLVRRVYGFTFVTLLLVALQVLLLSIFHANVTSIATVMAIVWTIHLLLVVLLHFFSKKLITMQALISTKLHIPAIV